MLVKEENLELLHPSCDLPWDPDDGEEPKPGEVPEPTDEEWQDALEKISKYARELKLAANSN